MQRCNSSACLGGHPGHSPGAHDPPRYGCGRHQPPLQSRDHTGLPADLPILPDSARPPAPWFHPGPLDGIVTDYMMKTRASSGRDGTLSLYAATDLRLLAEHSQALLLPHPGDPSAPPALYWIRSPT